MKNIIVNRNGKLFIHTTQNKIRLRFATGLKDTKKNREKVLELADTLIQVHLVGGNVKRYLQGQEDELVRENSFAWFAKEFQKELIFVKKSTKIGYTTILRNIKEKLGDVDVREIQREHLTQFYTSFMGKSKSTFKLHAQILKKVLDLAVIKGAIDKSPFYMPVFRPVKVKEDNATPFTFEEVQVLLKKAKESCTKDFYHYLVIAFFTGARTNEILALTRDDVREKLHIEKTLSLNEITLPKTQSSIRKIDILPPVRAALNAQMKLVGSRRTLFYKSLKKSKRVQTNFRKQWLALLAECGFSSRVLYSTRHSFATIMLSKNEPILWVAKMLGHKDASITLSTYAKYHNLEEAERASFLSAVEV